MAILKTKNGLVQLHKCSVCGYFVTLSDVSFDESMKEGQNLLCIFCSSMKTSGKSDYDLYMESLSEEERRQHDSFGYYLHNV